MKKDSNKGFTLLFGVLLMSLLLAVAFSIIGLSSKHLIISSVGRESQVAFYAADSGLECVKYWDQVTTDRNAFLPGAGKATISCFGNEAIPVTDVTSTEPDKTACENISGDCIPCQDSVGECKKYKVSFSLLEDTPGTPDGDVYVEKNVETNETSIDSYGRNTDTTGPRRLERAVKLTYTPVPRDLCSNRGDTMLVMDISGSISGEEDPNEESVPPSELDLLKASAKRFIDELNPSPPGTNIGMIWFKDHIYLKDHLKDSSEDLKNHVDELGYVNGGTNLSGGIRVARYELTGQVAGNIGSYNLTATGADVPVHDRDDLSYPDFMLILSDGSNRDELCKDGEYANGDDCTTGTYRTGDEGRADAIQDAIIEANDAKAQGITVYTIGIGTGGLLCDGYANCSDFLNRGVAGKYDNTDPDTEAPGYFFEVETFEDLDNFPLCL